MRQAHRVFEDAAPQNFGCNLLFAGKATIEPVNQNVCINESGNAGRGPLFSNFFREVALPDVPMDACGGVRSLDRTNGPVTLDFRVSLVWLAE